MGRLSHPYINASDIASFRRTIHMSMVVQADCLRAEAEHYRRGRDFAQRTGGSLFWMLDDNWASPSWASVEYGGRRKLLHYEAKRFYSTVAMSSHLLCTILSQTYQLSYGFILRTVVNSSQTVLVLAVEINVVWRRYCMPSIENCSAVNIHVTSDLTERTDLRATLQVNLTRWVDGATTTVMSGPLSIPAQNGSACSEQSYFSINGRFFEIILTGIVNDVENRTI